jgi:hypothetical protein
MKFFIYRHKINTRAQLSNLPNAGGLVLLLVSGFISLFTQTGAGRLIFVECRSF